MLISGPLLLQSQKKCIFRENGSKCTNSTTGKTGVQLCFIHNVSANEMIKKGDLFCSFAALRVLSDGNISIQQVKDKLAELEISDPLNYHGQCDGSLLSVASLVIMLQTYLNVQVEKISFSKDTLFYSPTKLINLFKNMTFQMLILIAMHRTDASPTGDNGIAHVLCVKENKMWGGNPSPYPLLDLTTEILEDMLYGKDSKIKVFSVQPLMASMSSNNLNNKKKRKRKQLKKINKATNELQMP